MIPLQKILIEILCLGIIVRSVYIIMSSIGEDDYKATVKKVRNRIIAGVIGLCLAELLHIIAKVYGYSGSWF